MVALTNDIVWNEFRWSQVLLHLCVKLNLEVLAPVFLLVYAGKEGLSPKLARSGEPG